VPDGVREHFQDGIGERGKQLRAPGWRCFEPTGAKHPDLADQLDRMQRRELPTAGTRTCRSFPPTPRAWRRATRPARCSTPSQDYPWLIGGAADLAPSTKTRLTFEGAGDFEAGNLRRPQPALRHPRARHGRDPERAGAVQDAPFGSTFLIFSDYMKPPIRLSALMELPVIYVFTHDSIGVGEDGPTHQPVEQLARCAAFPA
jgi:transketolase